MKLLLSIVITLAIAGGCGAATVTNGQINHRLTTKETSLGNSVVTNLDFALITTLLADITPAEAAAFGPNTRIQGGLPLGPSGSFRLADDPAYQAGKSSVAITSTTVFNNVAWKRTIAMRWDGGKLNLKVTLSVNQDLPGAAPVEWENLLKSEHKVADGRMLISFLADNLGTEFLSLAAPVITKTTIDVSSQTARRTGEVTLLSIQSVQGTKLAPE